MVYQNFLREFQSTTVAFDPFPSTDEPKKRPLREFLIKFSVLNGQRPLTLDLQLLLIIIMVLDRNYSSTKVDIGEIIYSDLVTKLLNKYRLKYVSYLRFISCALQVLLGFDYTQ
ncbi:hypothetical protein Tco_0036406, partial [Tanacetum coccineum]